MSPEELGKHIEKNCDGSNLAEQLHCERESLLSWGREKEILYTKDTFSQRKVGEEQYFGGGNEHDVYFDEQLGRVVKVTKLPESTEGLNPNQFCNFGAQESLTSYLKNLESHNLYFGDDIKIEGILEIEGFIAVISSQPFILGSKASELEIQEWFVSLGYSVGVRPHTFSLDESDRKISIFDARPDNVIKTMMGDIVPIDLQVIVTHHPKNHGPECPYFKKVKHV